MITKHRILELLDYVKDPEIPVINVLELGVVRGVALFLDPSLSRCHLSCRSPIDGLPVNRCMP